MINKGKPKFRQKPDNKTQNYTSLKFVLESDLRS